MPEPKRDIHWGRAGAIVGGVLLLGAASGMVWNDADWGDDDDHSVSIPFSEEDGGDSPTFDRAWNQALAEVGRSDEMRAERIEDLSEQLEGRAEALEEASAGRSDEVDAIADRLRDLGDELDQLENRDDAESAARRAAIEAEMQDEAAELARVGMRNVGEHLAEMIRSADTE